MKYQLTRVGRKILWRRLLLSVLTLFFLPGCADQSEHLISQPLETNQTVTDVQQLQSNSHFLLLTQVQQQTSVSRQQSKIQPVLENRQQHKLKQINHYQILIRAGPTYHI